MRETPGRLSTELASARRRPLRRRLCGAIAALLVPALPSLSADAPPGAVDTALVLAVDVSGSISPARYRLQMEGIAEAFEDASVQRAILSGARGALLITIVEWSDKPRVSIGWTLITAADDAKRFARRIRRLTRSAAQFTCMSRMLGFVADKVLPQAPLPAARTVVDVSGDGRENCNPAQPVDAVRDELVAGGATLNGLPILEGGEADTLEGWYTDHVIGGRGAFLMPASGFADFARAIRQKFVVEISWREP
jgi:hypothetical protein